jgi:hypothetical protein
MRERTRTLVYDMYADVIGEPNAFDKLRALGVTWERSEGHPIADAIKFYGCNHLPETLPNGFSYTADPVEHAWPKS